VALTVIANPASGRGRVARLLPEITATLAAIGIDARVVTTRDAQDLRDAVRGAREAGDARVKIARVNIPAAVIRAGDGDS
jgi:diacylglycerol kinase family enzyme